MTTDKKEYTFEMLTEIQNYPDKKTPIKVKKKRKYMNILAGSYYEIFLFILLYFVYFQFSSKFTFITKKICLSFYLEVKRNIGLS